MKSLSVPRRLPPVGAVLLMLVAAAVAIPLAANLPVGDGTVAAVRAPVAAERPFDRYLKQAASPRTRIGTVAIRATTRPRIVVPSPLFAALPDAAPDRSIARLSETAARPSAAVRSASRIPEPRRKPVRETVAAIALPEEGSVAAILPETVALALPEPPAPAARPAAPTGGDAPRIALVVTAAGLNDGTTRRAIEALPGGIALAFAPIGSHTETLAKAALADGHTVLAEIPMEPVNPRRDPGEPLTLRVANTGAANIDRLGKALARVPGASGVSSYLGAKFSRSEEAAAPVVGEIAARGLFLFENQPGGQSRLGALARARDVGYAASGPALDSDRNAALMLDRLAGLEAEARRRGVAIGVATAYRDSIDTLARWVAGAERRGVVFVPVTGVAADAG